MALVLANRVQETSTTTGTGTLTLAGAVLGYQTFSAGIGVGNTCYYAITSGTGAWEVGIGTVGAGTLARTTLLSSSTGSLVSFTGTLNVYVTYPSEKSVNLDASNIITGYPITVKDNVFTLQDDVDPTKQAQFQLSGLTTGTTFTYTLPNINTTLAGLSGTQTFTGNNTFSSTTNNFGSSVAGSTTQIAYGATNSGNTKVVNIGTSGASGSTTAITVGSANGSTTTMLGSTVIGGVAGNQSLQVNNVASAVNYAQIVGAVTGGAPVVSALGTDTDIGLTILGKGSGAINVGGTSGANPSLSVATVSSQVNSFQVYGNSAGNSPTLAAIGSDTNIAISIKSKGTGSVALQSNNQSVFGLSNVSGSDFTNYYTTTGNLNYTAAGGSTNINFYYQTKGTGGFNFTTGGGQQVGVANTASAVNYLNLTGAATGAAPTISAQGSDTNISLRLTPKGTGGVLIPSTTASTSVTTGALQVSGGIGVAGSVYSTGDFTAANNTSSGPASPVAGNQFISIGQIWNSGLGNRFMTGAMQVNAYLGNANPPVSKLSFLVGSDSGAASEKMFITSSGLFSINGGASFSGPTLDDTYGAVYIRNLTAATNLASAPSNKLFFQGYSWNSAAGNVQAQSYIQSVTVTNNANPTVDGLIFAPFSGGATGSGSTPLFAMTNQGRLGIGNIAPTQTLDVTNTAGNRQFTVSSTTLAVNYLQATGAVTTGAPELSAQGSDTNINLKLTPKGTGDVQITGTAYSPNFNLTDAATIAWDTATAGGQVATFTFVSSNRTMGAPTNLVNGAFYALAVIQNAGSNTLTWNSVFKFAGGIAPTLSTAAGAKDYFTFRSDGTNLYQQGISQAVA